MLLTAPKRKAEKNWCFFVFFLALNMTRNDVFLWNGTMLGEAISHYHISERPWFSWTEPAMCVVLPLSNFGPQTIRDIGFQGLRNPPPPWSFFVSLFPSQAGKLWICHRPIQRETDPGAVRMPAGRVNDTQYPCWEWKGVQYVSHMPRKSPTDGKPPPEPLSAFCCVYYLEVDVFSTKVMS